MMLYGLIFGHDYGRYYRRSTRLRDRAEQHFVRAILRYSSGGRVRVSRNARVSPHALVSGDVRIGPETAVMPHVVIRAGGSREVRIGSHCSLNPYVCVFGGATIGNHVRIATHVVIVPMQHRFDRTDVPIHGQGVTSQGVVIEDDVWIGMNVSILDGVRVGRGAIVGAGSVVTRDVPPEAIVVGNPARVLRYRDGRKPDAELDGGGEASASDAAGRHGSDSGGGEGS